MVIMVVTMDHRGDLCHAIKCKFCKSICAPSHLLFLVFGFYLSITNFNVYAEIAPRVSVTQYYNDNVTLAPEGSEEYANITEIIPGISYFHDGKRIDAAADYRLQALYFSGKKDKDEIHHTANGQASIAIVPQSLFFDVSVSYSQQFISPEVQLDPDNLSASQNRTDVLSVESNPYLRQRYGNMFSAEYRYSYNELQYDDPITVTERDSVIQAAEIDLVSGPAFDEILWRLLMSSSNMSADDVRDSTFQRGIFFTKFRVSPKLEYLIDLGYEDNDYQQVGNADQPKGSIWNVGMGWNPSGRTRLEIKTGERYFGKISNLVFKHSTRRSTWNIGYSKDITTIQQFQSQLRDVAIQVQNTEGELETINLPVEFVERISSVVMVQRASTVISYQKSKSTIALGFYNDIREYQEDGRKEDSMGGNISWNWRLMPRTTLRLAGNWYRLKLLSGERVDHYGLGEMILSRQISRTITGSMGYKITDRNSTDVSAEYARNLVYVSASMEF